LLLGCGPTAYHCQKLVAELVESRTCSRPVAIVGCRRRGGLTGAWFGKPVPTRNPGTVPRGRSLNWRVRRSAARSCLRRRSPFGGFGGRRATHRRWIELGRDLRCLVLFVLYHLQDLST
jgi:hypothetical protein